MLTHDDICRAIGDVAQKYIINNAYYFGSYARGTQTEDSDLDMLVEFCSPAVSLFDISGLTEDLNEKLGIKVDVVRLPLSPETLLHIEKVVKCYGTTRSTAFSKNT